MPFDTAPNARFAGRCKVCATYHEAASLRLRDGAATCRNCYDRDAPAPDATPLPAPAFSDDDLNRAVAKIAELSAAFACREVPGMVDAKLATVDAMVAAAVAKLNRELDIKVGAAPRVNIKQAHKALPTVLATVAAGASPFLVGPAGSGKTTLAEQVAKAMGVKFYMAARVTSEFKLTGFIDARGECVRTQFREAYEHGGGFLFDEVDASDPDALTAFNAALANGYGDFPDGMVKRHPKFFAIAAGNTYGRGADRQYVGRNQLDAATLDRFVVLEIEYDEQLELALAGNADWTAHVQAVRAAILAENVRHIVSPRASIMGAKMLAAGMERSVVEEATVWKGLPAESRNRIVARMSR